MRRTAIIGTGLIGGSIGLGLVRGSEAEVIGYDVDPGALTGALQVGAINRAASNIAAAAAEADLVVLAVPTERIPGLCAEVAEAAPPRAVVTDVGSAKIEVVEAGRAALGGRFVGGHPMAGSERHGIEAAEPSLFEEAWWVLTPTEETSSTSYGEVAGLATSLGARPVAVDPFTHDALAARLSHLPQLVASALVDVASRSGDREALLGLAGAGFRDVTRIAASNPDLWVGIIRSNTDAVLDAIAGLDRSLDFVADAIRRQRWDELGAWLAGSRRARIELFAKPDYGEEPVALAMVVPDRPGVLAEVTTAAGELGANIEDLRIIHSTEGGQGRLELVVAGREPAELLAATLIRLGYRVHRAQIN
ncbi:MAG: prephenate dehydrogenase/arogenate dehydrogenase family protein [Actinomycetota bacterium]|nr:prephenate dehydrogenase/arogenate dehydrogenase family protein [Actinomycetota bacterium]